MQQPITHLSLVPTQLWRLLREGFDPRHTQLRELLLGGAAIPAPLVERLQRLGLTPKVSYGLSEMASQVCTGLPSAPGVVGQPLPGRQVRVVDGEIQVKGDTLFCGYLADGALDPAVNDEGWFATRDRGYFNDQQALVVEGRLDNVFISGGENIHPEEVEATLETHASIAECSVVGLTDSRWGQIVIACVVAAGDQADVAEFDAHFRASALAPFKRPRGYVFVNDLPKNAAGKVLRRLLRDLVVKRRNEKEPTFHSIKFAK